MNPHDLRTYFPNAKPKEFPSFDEKVISVPYKNYFLWILKDELSDKEKCLAAALSITPRRNEKLARHKWYKILFEDQNSPSTKSRYRILQFKVNAMNDANEYRKLWQENLNEFFPQRQDAFFISDSEYLLIEEQGEPFLDQEEIAGILTTLDSDFEVKSSAFIGEFYQSSQALKPLFREEQELFYQAISKTSDQKVVRFSDLALRYLTEEKITQSVIAANLKKILLQEDDSFRQLVRMMWKYFGNVSSVSKEMYTHRNTINYRIDKIREQTGFNLKNSDDLLLCYLLLFDDAN